MYSHAVCLNTHSHPYWSIVSLGRNSCPNIGILGQYLSYWPTYFPNWTSIAPISLAGRDVIFCSSILPLRDLRPVHTQPNVHAEAIAAAPPWKHAPAAVDLGEPLSDVKVVRHVLTTDRCSYRVLPRHSPNRRTNTQVWTKQHVLVVAGLLCLS